ENLASGYVPGLIQYGDRFLDVADALQQRDGRCVLRAQQSDCAQIERLLGGGQAGIEFLQPRREKFHALTLEVKVRIPRHEQKQQLRVSRRCPAIDRFQILEGRMTRRGSSTAFALAGGKSAVRNDEGAPDEKRRSEQAEQGFE